MTQFEKRTHRAREYLTEISRQFPRAWSMADDGRAARGTTLPDWPEWCYLPMAGWYAIACSHFGVDRLDFRQSIYVSHLAALGAWRMTQGIYRIDPALYEALVTTSINDIPAQVLYRLPEWCIYIETPTLGWAAAPLHGAWVHLECDASTGRHELRILTDQDIGKAPHILHLGPWSLTEAVERAFEESRRQAHTTEHRWLAQNLADIDVDAAMRPVVEPLLSLVLYICTQSDITGKRGAPGNPQPVKTRRGGWRLFPADGPRVWDVGVRIGAALRAAYQAEQVGTGDAHAGPRPHVRRAHWHGFRSGPRKRPDGSEIPVHERRFDLRWLPPIPVNLNDVDDLPAVIREVR